MNAATASPDQFQMPVIEAHFDEVVQSEKNASVREKKETCLPALSARFSTNNADKRSANHDFKSFKAASSVVASQSS